MGWAAEGSVNGGGRVEDSIDNELDGEVDQLSLYSSDICIV